MYTLEAWLLLTRILAMCVLDVQVHTDSAIRQDDDDMAMETLGYLGRLVG